MKQSTLFDPSRTQPTPCPVLRCAAIRFPEQDKVPTCESERERTFANAAGSRPRGCLNAHDPEHAPFPKGF